jgi:hypothetical protein
MREGNMRAITVYCCNCGAENPNYGRYCHRCGNALISGAINDQLDSKALAQRQPTAAKALSEEEEDEVRGLRKLHRIDTKPLECHSCGRTEGLIGYKFGLAKVLSSKRDWTRTVGSVVLSAISVPLVGVGKLELPGKSNKVRALRLRLVLCESCRAAQLNYPAHPWWHSALKLGYNTLLSERDMEQLGPGWVAEGTI